ncbi:hypothetical protein B7463_g7419, partial [Scytalidium lignicola]
MAAANSLAVANSLPGLASPRSTLQPGNDAACFVPSKAARASTSSRPSGNGAKPNDSRRRESSSLSDERVDYINSRYGRDIAPSADFSLAAKPASAFPARRAGPTPLEGRVPGLAPVSCASPSPGLVAGPDPARPQPVNAPQRAKDYGTGPSMVARRERASALLPPPKRSDVIPFSTSGGCQASTLLPVSPVPALPAPRRSAPISFALMASSSISSQGSVKKEVEDEGVGMEWEEVEVEEEEEWDQGDPMEDVWYGDAYRLGGYYWLNMDTREDYPGFGRLSDWDHIE